MESKNKKPKVKKRKWKKVLLILACIFVVLAIAGYFVYREVMVYVGNMVIKEVTKSEINRGIAEGSISEDELLIMAGEAPAPDTAVTADNTEGEGATDDAVTSEAESPQIEDAGTNSTPSESGESGSSGDTQPQAPQKPKNEATTESKPKMSAEEQSALVDKASDNIARGVSREDKEAMAKLITSRLSGSDISYLSGLIQGGLTREEREKAYDVAVARFQGEELAEVSRFYHKYKKQIMSEPDWDEI